MQCEVDFYHDYLRTYAHLPHGNIHDGVECYYGYTRALNSLHMVGYKMETDNYYD